MSSPVSRTQRRENTSHYDLTPPKFTQEVKKIALVVLKKSVPVAAGTTAGVLSFTAANQAQGWLTSDCTGYKMLIVWYLFSLIVIASVQQGVARLAFRAEKLD